MKKVLKRLLLILFLIAIAFIVIVYLFGLPQNIARVSNYESLTTNIWIDDDYISVEEKFLIKDLIPKEQEQSEEVLTEEYRLELPIQNKYGYKIGTSDISSITSNISYFNPSSINNIKYRDGVYIVQIAPGNLENLRQEIQSNNNFIKINYKLKTSNILLKNDKTQNIELKVSTGNSGFQDNYLIVHLEDGVKVLNQDSLVKDESDNTCTISLNGFPKTYIINLSSNAVKGDITSSIENGLIYKYMLDRICDISLVIIAAITLVLVIVIVVIHLKRIVKVIKINPDENKDFSVDPVLIEYVLTGKHDVKKLIEHGIYSKKGENLLKTIRALIRLITLITVLIFLAIIVLEKSNAGYVIMCTGLIFINIIAYSFTKVHVFTKQGKKQYGVALSYKNIE